MYQPVTTTGKHAGLYQIGYHLSVFHLTEFYYFRQVIPVYTANDKSKVVQFLPVPGLIPFVSSIGGELTIACTRSILGIKQIFDVVKNCRHVFTCRIPELRTSGRTKNKYNEYGPLHTETGKQADIGHFRNPCRWILRIAGDQGR